MAESNRTKWTNNVSREKFLCKRKKRNFSDQRATYMLKCVLEQVAAIEY